MVKDTQPIEENINQIRLDGKENKYWVDDSNFVWKSIQSISPRLPKIYIEVTKKASMKDFFYKKALPIN